MTHAIVAEVPLVPAAGAIVGYLGSLLAFCLAVALTVLWVQILRGPLVRIASVSVLRHHPFGWLNTVVGNVDEWLKAAEQGGERGMVWSLHTLMWSLSTSAKLTRDLARETWGGLDWWKRHTTRHVGAQTAQNVTPRVRTLEREYKGIDARVDRVERREQAKRATGAAAGAQDESRLRRGIDRLTKRVGHVERELHGIEHAQAHAGAHAVPGATAIPRTAPRTVPRTRAPAHHWTDVLTKLSAAALVGYALARMGLNWLRCPALGRIGRKVGCGGFSWLEGFLATTFEALVVLDLCRFALAAQQLARLLVPQLAGTLLVQNAVCLGGGASYPSAHDSPKVSTRLVLPSAHD